MQIILPCKLGERFTTKKFSDWVDGKRIYKDDKIMFLGGFSKSIFNPSISAYSVNREHTEFFTFANNQEEYYPKYIIEINDGLFQNAKLKTLGFPSNRTGRLLGIDLKDGYVMAHFCVEPRYEHFYFVIRDIEYSDYGGNIKCMKIEYDKDADLKRKEEIKKCVEQEVKITHREEISIGKDIKEKIIALTIDRCRDIGIKVRKTEIQDENITGKYMFNGKIEYNCTINLSLMGSRTLKFKKAKLTKDIFIFNDNIVFMFSNIC